ncbi:MAG: hypothetical protein KGQ59_02885 [Bdellovibrionales bacterium]|nr:hypothetical protein [Bdellovibrionales bacterium]
MLKPRLAAAVLLLALSMGGCSARTGSVTPRMMGLLSNLPSVTPVPTPISTFPTPTATPVEASTDVLLDSYQVPVRSIELVSTAGEYSEIYRCDKDTNDGCLVDLMTGTDRDLLSARAIPVDEGTYDQVVIRTCLEEGSYQFQVKGSASITSGTQTGTYSTQTGSYPCMNCDPGLTSLTARQCAYQFELEAPLVVQPDSKTVLSFYYELRNLSWMALKSSVTTPPTPAAWSSSGCTGNASGSYDSTHPVFLCAGFPQFHARVGEAPVQERYLINNRAVLGLFFDPSDYWSSIKTPLGGYLRRYYGSESPAGEAFNFGVPLRRISRKSNGDFTFAAEGATSSSSSYFQSTNFPGDLNVTDNTSDTGTFTGELSGSTVNPYTVMRLE